MAPPLTLQPVTLENTLGAVFLGLVVSCILFGVSSLQMYFYYHHYPHDTLLHKSSIAALWVLDALHLSLTVYSTYYYGILGFGDPSRLASIIWFVGPSVSQLHIAINVVIILLVQSLYAYRVWILGGYHHGILGYFVAAVVLGGFGIGICAVTACKVYSISSFRQLPDIAWAIEASFAASTAIDIVISCAMCYYLRKSKGKESRLNSRISVLMQYTLSAGVFTSACSVVCLFTFILMSDNFIFLALTFILTRLYVTSFIAMMNARERSSNGGVSTFESSSPREVQVLTHQWPMGGGAGMMSLDDLEANTQLSPADRKRSTFRPPSQYGSSLAYPPAFTRNAGDKHHGSLGEVWDGSGAIGSMASKHHHALGSESSPRAL
ncbi:unnamed protein product [Mycena citricolor]|uniref:DUF6534 domain-containing protein n=1 Tax=Mycena citricolor TaxID=2018698 RepID=A0AAD2H9V4_9AGAR|nr:unnamed protein product [Mycena citricolor]